MAVTLETAARGVIYEHTPQSLAGAAAGDRAEDDARADARSRARTVFDREAAIVLRAIEQGARGRADGRAGGDDAPIWTLIARLLQVSRHVAAGAAGPATAAASPLILP